MDIAHPPIDRDEPVFNESAQHQKDITKAVIRQRFYPMDFIASAAIIGYILLLFFDKGEQLTAAVAVIIGFYFGNRSTLNGISNPPRA